MKLSMHCCSANQRVHEVWRALVYQLCRQVATSAHFSFMAEFLLFPVASILFNFVTIPLTVDRGIFSSKEISLLDLLHRWQPITVPHLNSLSS
ncbi:unnamed protein product [Staurois parvus]|uniref:Uncharacterized protein n=1 Tax=Staurois parvus TaxID=386267 RepID=A0ABN9E2V3_9NEOB|nr:unnamed protein product [Staurois parvus]